MFVLAVVAYGASQQQCSSDDASRGLDAGRHGVARRWADAFVESGRLAGLVVAVRRVQVVDHLRGPLGPVHPGDQRDALLQHGLHYLRSHNTPR